MIFTRREFLTTSSLVVAGSALRSVPLVGQQPTAPPVTKFTDLRRNVGIFTGQGGTIGWFVSPDAALVVDSQFPATAQICLDGLKSRSPRGIDTLVNTHHHGDHTAGNKTFRPAVKKIVAHVRVQELQKKAAATAKTEADQVYPDTTFPDTWKMDLGTETVSAKHYGPGHTGGDIVVFFEKADVVHMGDLMFNRFHPFVDRPAGASIANWITTLEQVSAAHTAQTMYVFGHGKEGFGVTGSKGELMIFRDYLTAALDTVRKAIKEGKSKDEIVKLDSLPGFTDFASPSPRLSLSGVLSVAHEELTVQG